MLQKLKSLLFYAGLDQKTYEGLIPDVQKGNQNALKACSFIATIVFALLFIFTFLTTSFADDNLLIYGIFVAINFIIYLCARYILPSQRRLTTPTMYLFVIGLYAFSLVVTSLHTEYPSVSTIVMLFMVPLIMLDKPIRMVLATALAVVSLCVISLYSKSSELAVTDLWNAISFGIVAIVSETLVQHNMFKLLYHEATMTRLGKIDLLTGLNNRNFYEQQIKEYPWLCANRLVCVYADANGLHEINNEQGHTAGDRLLISTADALIGAFGKEHVFRIGGDEFVCFDVDGREEDVRRQMERIDRGLKEQGYSVSWGVASAEKYSIDMKILTSKAEAEMYESKRRYYQESGHDRRR